MTYQAGTRVEKTGATNMPVYVPNLVEGLGTVQVLFYNNMTSKWELITPTSVDVANKMIHVTIRTREHFRLSISADRACKDNMRRFP